MGKKGSWFSAIKRVFIPNSKDKLVDGLEKKDAKEKKKKAVGKPKQGHSFIPLFREPSTIEQILGEAEREHHLIDFRPISPFEQPSTPSFLTSRATTPLQRPPISPWTPSPQIKASTTPRISMSPSKGSASQRTFSAPKITTPQMKVSSPRNASISDRSLSSRYVHRPRIEPTLRYQHICATKIQSSYRGYSARRSYRALRGLVRLQGVIKGQNVKRQTVNAMKCMQLLVRVQTQIQSRRIQMLESQAMQRQKNDKSVWDSSQLYENGNEDEWDDSRLSKEEIEARTRRKFEAMIKRERAMAYAYSHQVFKASPKTPQAALTDIRSSAGFPWWWNWLDRSERNPVTTENKPVKSLFSTPKSQTGFGHLDSATPRTRLTPTTPPNRPPSNKITRARANNASNSPFSARFKDDDSLTSCPPFSVAPRYMDKTLSAKAKAKGEFEASFDVQSNKRASFPLGQGIGGFKWNKRGSLFSAATTPSREKVIDKKQSLQSIGNLSVDSTVSMPANVGRKPFNRFV